MAETCAAFLSAALAWSQQQWRKRQLGRRCRGSPAAAAAASPWSRWQQAAEPTSQLRNTSRFSRHAARSWWQGHNIAQRRQQGDSKHGSGGRLHGLHRGAVLARCRLFLEPHHSYFYASIQCFCSAAAIAVFSGEGLPVPDDTERALQHHSNQTFDT